MPDIGHSWLAFSFHFSQFIKVFVTHTAMAGVGSDTDSSDSAPEFGGRDFMMMGRQPPYDIRGHGRLPHGQKKRGDSRAGTDAAHILSWEVARAALGPVGRPTLEATAIEFARLMNSDMNMRIKSIDGNRRLDRALDAAIIAAIEEGSLLTARAPMERAIRQYRFAVGHSSNPQMAIIADRIGDIGYKEPGSGPGRPQLIRHM